MIYDVLVIGGGPAGLAAAQAARENGATTVRILERDTALGGILNQCIHNGFGLHCFKEELTGPEYAQRVIAQLGDVEVSLNTMVLQITKDRAVHAVSHAGGYEILQAKALVLAMGCRERTRGAIAIAGARPAGVLTAGTAQHYVNMEGHMVGKRVVILGSGDIGLIMARRLTLEGAKVLACLELLPDSGGLTRNIAQCLNDFDIPLLLSHTVIDVRGEGRVSQVVAARVDERRNPIPGTEITFDCDTLLLSVGLIPENELTRAAGIALDPRTGGAAVASDLQTDALGIFACGNAVHVHDLVDFVTLEGRQAGAAAARFAAGLQTCDASETAVPQANPALHGVPAVATNRLNCIVCPKGCLLTVDAARDSAVSGAGCRRGEQYARQELTDPHRTLTSTVRLLGGVLPRLPVKTDAPIPQKDLSRAMAAVNRLVVHAPVELGQILLCDIGGTGVNLVATRSV